MKFEYEGIIKKKKTKECGRCLCAFLFLRRTREVDGERPRLALMSTARDVLAALCNISRKVYRVGVVVKAEHQQCLMLGPDAWKSGVLALEISLGDTMRDFPFS